MPYGSWNFDEQSKRQLINPISIKIRSKALEKSIAWNLT